MQVARAFRADERGERHNAEFTLLEWYAAGEDYRDLMAHTEELVAEAAAVLEGEGVATRLAAWPRPFARLGVDEAFERWAGWRPSQAFDEERFFEDFVTKVEARLEALGAVFLADWPAPAGALARRSGADPAICERVELVLDGVEICNGFSELTDGRRAAGALRARQRRAGAAREGALPDRSAFSRRPDLRHPRLRRQRPRRRPSPDGAHRLPTPRRRHPAGRPLAGR